MELRDRHDSAYQGSAFGRGHYVSRPPVHEGVGNALRHAYVPRANDLPDDMIDLLAKLG